MALMLPVNVTMLLVSNHDDSDGDEDVRHDDDGDDDDAADDDDGVGHVEMVVN